MEEAGTAGGAGPTRGEALAAVTLVRRETFRNQIAGNLRRAIISGGLEPGSPYVLSVASLTPSYWPWPQEFGAYVMSVRGAAGPVAPALLLLMP